MLDREFNFKPSRYYLFLVMVFFGLSLIILPFLSIPFWVKGMLGLSILVYGFSIVWRVGLLRHRHSIISIRRLQDSWRITMPFTSYDAQLRNDSTITGVISILRFQVPHTYWSKTCIVFPDSLRSDEYRQLLVVLKMG